MDRNDLAACFENAVPNSTQKQKMLRNILSDRKEAIIPMRRTRPRFIAVAAIIVAFVMTATTALAVTLGWHEKLMEYLNPSQTPLELLGISVNEPLASVTDNGVTVTVLQTLTDGYTVYVLYEIDLPENETDLPENITLGHHAFIQENYYLRFTFSGEIMNFGYNSYPKILEHDGNKLTVLSHIGSSIPLSNCPIKLEINKIGSLNGNWTLTWDFSVDDNLDTIELSFGEEALTHITITPMSIFLKANGMYQPTGSYPQVNLKDGSRVFLSGSTTGLNSVVFSIRYVNGNVEHGRYYSFENIINLDDVVSVTIGNVTIPVE